MKKFINRVQDLILSAHFPEDIYDKAPKWVNTDCLSFEEFCIDHDGILISSDPGMRRELYYKLVLMANEK